ncbi:Tetratricopeptide repeat protein 37 [Homalodisca vitripennis]|nr:Tetratricopeptide repeat protein 37 [Homalodisca vitripennis]
MVRKWIRAFKDGRTNVYDEERSGRPSVITDDLIQKVNCKVKGNRPFTISFLAEKFPAVSRSVLYEIVSSSHMWEALADAYMARGANGSALKSYQKVLELKPGAFYPALQIATIKQMTELADESLLEFRELVMAQPASPLALKGLCETCLYLAREHLTTRLMGLARDRLQEGLIAIASAVQLRPDLTCLWKLAGECLTLAGSLPRSWHYLTVPEVLRSKSASEATQQGLQLLQLGARCLCRCLKLMSGEGQAAVWHDLALNYRQQVELSDTRDGICQRALAAAKESVTLDPGSWQHWNQLGIVAALPGQLVVCVISIEFCLLKFC